MKIRAAARVSLAAIAIVSAARSLAGSGESPAREPDRQAIVHFLSRTTYGPRPVDVARVQRIGLARYIDEQLHPERIDDTAIEGRLAGFETSALTSREIAEQYARPALEARRERQRLAKPRGEETTPAGPGDEVRRANQPLVELSEQKILRAAYSERQLQEVLVDFWFNHFNVDARKGPDRFLLTAYERDAIRPHVLGSFRELLGATAKSPAMLFYLDNWMSAADPAGARQSGARRGLNENYGRELMELHTLGVDGGYTQRDVTEVARAFTGWTVQQPRRGGPFRFDPRAHDRGAKIVLGHRIAAGGGIEDGERVLDILAAQPATARFIAGKLARRFVSDAPPPALVDRVAARFTSTHGDLRAVMREILAAPELLAPSGYRAKVKTPFEFVVSAVRALDADVTRAAPLVRAVQQLGMPLYQCQPPTGYHDTADAWVNAGALVERMNLALALASGRVPGVAFAPERWTIDAALFGEASPATRETIARAPTKVQQIALALGSPEFQRR
ncbi:MAG: DUF1800 domain-containing protein [Acidobacteria bacterium]|nr:DUF1800 domain-containing protein [Acidobacteriota bacterium]